MSRSIEVVNLEAALARVAEAWSPMVVAAVGDYVVKVVKARGEFVWHSHRAEDELFLVLRGTLTMRLRDGDRTVGPGEFVVVPRGTEHCPAAEEEVHVVLFEPAATKPRGDPDSQPEEATPTRACTPHPR